MTNLNLVGIVGSLRSGSANRALARAAVDAVPDGVDLTLHDVADVPFYNGDVEASGGTDSVNRLRAAVSAADGVLLFSPEYNGSFPAVTKNVIDWLSRDRSTWDGTAITMLSITPGPRAGLGVREHFSAIMPFQATRLFETFGVGTYGDKLDDDGNVVDAQTLDDLADFLARFSIFAGDTQMSSRDE